MCQHPRLHRQHQSCHPVHRSPAGRSRQQQHREGQQQQEQPCLLLLHRSQHRQVPCTRWHQQQVLQLPAELLVLALQQQQLRQPGVLRAWQQQTCHQHWWGLVLLLQRHRQSRCQTLIRNHPCLGC
jgi:hypothetical protein